MASLTRSGSKFKPPSLEKENNKETEDDDKRKYINKDGSWVEPPASATRDMLLDYMEARNRLDADTDTVWVINQKQQNLERISLVSAK